MIDLKKTIAGILVLTGTFAAGVTIQAHVDRAAVDQARANEAQANGLEDEARAALKEPFTRMEEDKKTGDYRLSVYGGRRLVCEEKDVTIVSQPDAEEPLVLSCDHTHP